MLGLLCIGFVMYCILIFFTNVPSYERVQWLEYYAMLGTTAGKLFHVGLVIYCTLVVFH